MAIDIFAKPQAATVPALTDTQIKDAASTEIGGVSGKLITDAIRSKTEQISAQFSTGTTIDLTTLGLAKNQRLYLYSSTGAPAQLKVRFIDSFTKTVSVNGATGTTVGDLVTIDGVQSAIVYQEFAEASSVGGITRIVCDPGSASTRPVVTGVNTDQGLATWQANAKAGDIAEDIRTGTIHESRGSGGALRLTPNWIDRMDYTVTSATSIADGLVADSLISGMNTMAFLRSGEGRKAIIRQAAATTLGALFTDANARLTARSLATIPEMGYRRSVAAPNWMFYNGTDPVDAATAVPSGWYVVTSVGGTDIYIEPLAAQVSQIIPYTGTTPDIPANTALPALAVNTTTGRITHWWKTDTLVWTAIAIVPTPRPSNYNVNTSAARFYKPTTTVAAGGIRSNGRVTPPTATTDFLMEDGDWDGELQLPANPAQGRYFNFRNNATLTTTVLAAGTNMPSGVSVATGQSLHFVANAGGVWEWVAIPAAGATSSVSTKIPPTWLQAGNSRGSWVTVGTIQVAVTASGNAQMMIRSVSGTITVTTTTSTAWDNQRHVTGQSITTSSTFTPGVAGWSFNSIDNIQDNYITDTTNNRTYFVRMIVQSNHLNQRFFVYEL